MIHLKSLIVENEVSIKHQGLVDDGVYGYELRSDFSYLRYGYEKNSNIYYLYNIGTPREEDKNKGYAKQLLYDFFKIIKRTNGKIDPGSFTTSGNSYIKPVIDRLALQYGIRVL